MNGEKKAHPDSIEWEAVCSGDGWAFARLFEKYRDRVFRHGLHLVSSRHDAEDLTAMVFLEAWRRRDTLRQIDGTILPWLLVTANNVARNHRRSRRRYSELLQRLPIPSAEPDHANDVIDSIISRDESSLVRAEFSRLSGKDRNVLTLCVLELLSISEAAEILGVPSGTVKSRLHRARNRLAANVSDARVLTTCPEGT